MTRGARRGARSGPGLAPAVAAALLAGAAGAAPVEMRDPEVLAGEAALRAGDHERARTVLELAAPLRQDGCAALAEALDPDAPERLVACLGAARAWIGLGIARGILGDATGAWAAFAEAARLHPELRPDPELTPPRIVRVFEAARAASSPAGDAPGALPGFVHHPPLVAVRGNVVGLDLAPRSTDEGELPEPATVEVLYAVGTVAEGTYRVRCVRNDLDLWAADLPAAATLPGRSVAYRFEAVSATGRVTRSRWYPLRVVESVARLPLADLRTEIEPATLAALGRLTVVAETSAPATLSDGLRVAERPASSRSEDGPGGLVGFVADVLQ